MGQIGQLRVDEYDGPQPNQDFFEGDEVELLSRSGVPTGMRGIIRRFEGLRQGIPHAFVVIDEATRDVLPLNMLRRVQKLAQGRPMADPFVMPEIGETQGEAQKRNSPALQKTCPVCQSTNAPEATNCANCGSSLDTPYMVPRQQKQRVAQVGSYMVNPPANRNVMRPTTETFERRTKRPTYPDLSDEHADIIDEDHINQVGESANALGLE